MKRINFILDKCMAIAVLLLAMVLYGCESNFLDTVPSNGVSSQTIWTTSNLAQKAVTGVYAELLDPYRDQPFWDVHTVILDYDRNWLGDVPDLTGTAVPSSGLFSKWWKRCYESIHRANDVIANISKVPDMSDADKARFIAEMKFLRAYHYMELNILYKGVPVYLEPVEPSQATNGRESESAVWDIIVKDLTDCINEPNLPNKYDSGNSNYGHITKGAAYALRGKVYLWLKEWGKAEQDFKTVGTLGYSLFSDYKALFKEANERCDEMIFTVQCFNEDGLGNIKNWRFGTRVTYLSLWNNYLVNPKFVDSYECSDGKKFDWEDFIPGYTSMGTSARAVFFLRDGITESERSVMTEYGADMSKYLPDGNEARIKKAYSDRDPRMDMTIIVPYSTYFGGITGQGLDYTLRWPWRSQNTPYFDLTTDTNAKYYYLMRKFVGEGTEINLWNNSPIDMPVIRYGDVLLCLAEALNEQGKVAEAVAEINKVRARAGAILLNTNEHTTVTGQENLRQRIRNERYWELAGEDVVFFDELRWGTWKDTKFYPDNGLMEIWGTQTYKWMWPGEKMWKWPIPQAEMEKNQNLTQNEGWY